MSCMSPCFLFALFLALYPPIDFPHEFTTCFYFLCVLCDCCQLSSIVCSGCISQRYWFGVWRESGKASGKEGWNGMDWIGLGWKDWDIRYLRFFLIHLSL